MTVTRYVFPVAVIIKVVQSGYLCIIRYVLVADRPAIRVIVIRVVQISTVVPVPSIVRFGITIGVVVVDNAAGNGRIQVRDVSILLDVFGAGGPERQASPLSDLSAAAKSNHLGRPSENRADRSAVIADSNLVQTGLHKIYGAAWCSHLEQLSGRNRANVEHSRAIPQRQLSAPLGQRQDIERSI
jgi:hypothetical protein